MSVLMASQFNFALLCIPEMVNVVFDIQRYHVPQWGFYILFFFAKRTTKDTGNDNYDVLIVSIVQSYFIIR